MYIGERLKLSEDEEGQQREPFMVEYLSQDEPMGKYLGKKYRVPRAVEQYKKDVQCQMTARYYVGLFNQELYHKGKMQAQCFVLFSDVASSIIGWGWGVFIH